jgi:hypothetical protein
LKSSRGRAFALSFVANAGDDVSMLCASAPRSPGAADLAQTDVRRALIQRQLGIDDVMAIVRSTRKSMTKSAKSPSHMC